MATSQYFNNYNSKYSDQRVIEDLIVESIKIMGFDAYYLPNDNDAARDLLYGEDPVKKFNSAFQLEMYLADSSGYGGQQEFFSKFGLEIKNTVNVIVSRRTYQERVPQDPKYLRPREGDLIYVPFLNGTGELFEIRFVEQAKDFFQLGRQAPYFYELELEKFKYSHERIATGVPDIDEVVTENSYTLTLEFGNGTGNYTSQEVVYQSLNNQANATAVAIVQTWNLPTKELTVTNIAGVFADNTRVIGASSNAQYILTTYDPLNINVPHDHYDNLYIEQQANSIIDFSETNPFGTL
jgi:hypothetical protein